MFCIAAQAQDLQQNLDSFSGKFISAIKSREKAQAYLTTDKSIFKAGESIWFRGFLLNSVTQKIYTNSKYLFVDLVNEKDSVISIVILDAAHQQLNGQIILPANISPGYYWLRAYNKLMVEEDTSNCFIKPVYVISSSGKPASKMTGLKMTAGKNNPIAVMKFYPEGGTIMTGANSTVAFLIQTPEQIPVVTEGYIKDNRDSIVTHFFSNKFGLGKFTFFPSSFKKYRAYINWNGKEINYPLPSFNYHAGQLAVEKQTEGKITLRVLLEDSLYKKDLITYVIGVGKDDLCFAAIGHGQYELEVAEQKFPEGIATFYLFNKDFNLLSERSIYIKENNLLIRASVDKKNYGKRDKVTLSVSVTDALDHPVPSLFSVAVIDTAFSNQADECMIPDFNNPMSINNISLANMNCYSKADLDLIMLLKNNNFLITGSHKVKAPTNDYDNLFFIKGRVLDEKNNPATNKVLTLFYNSGNQIFLTGTTDNAGLFSFPVSDYFDNTQFAIEAKNLSNKSLKVQIVRDPIMFPHFNTPVSLKHYFSAEPVFTNKYRSAYLDTPFTDAAKRFPAVFITKKEVNYDQSKRVSRSSTIITSDQLDERQSVGNTVLNTGGLHMLNGFLLIHGLTAMKAPNAGSEPLLLIDGAQAASVGSVGADISPVMSILNSLNPKEIDFIEILKGGEGANYGLRGGNGVILVNTAHSPKDNFVKGSNLQTFYTKGISTPSLFPQINYADNAIRSSDYFDNRSTIFWDGSILTGATDKVSLNFFTNDIPSTFKVIINGITVHGDIIYKTVTFLTNNKLP